MAKDPICGMYVEESLGALSATVDGKTFYFCCPSCMGTFTAPVLELRSLKRDIALSLVLGVPILILSYVSLLPSSPTGFLLLAMATPVQFYAGRRFYQGAWSALKTRSSNMDLLIATGTSAAYFYSVAFVLFPTEFPFAGLFFDASAMIVALLLIGRFLEQTVKAKATESVRRLADLQPTTALVVGPGGAETVTPLERLAEGDVFLVRSGERIATDGVVLEGRSSVNEKLVTGESVPIEKNPGSAVIGATINGSGLLKVMATRVGADTTISKIAQIVEDAQKTKSPVESLVNTVSIYFVPTVFVVSLASFSFWALVAGKPISFAFTVAVAVLVIACPCALGLATPAAIAVGAGKGAENGILIKGGDQLERAQKIDTVVFDKTGTLTLGEPSVADVISFSGGVREAEVLNLAAIAERGSEHPLASAVLAKFKEMNPGVAVPEPDSFDSYPGLGTRATFHGSRLLFGSPTLLQTNGVVPDSASEAKAAELRDRGKTVMMLAKDDRVIGLVAAADRVKPNARESISWLRKMGLKVIMVSGDNAATCGAVARELGIETYFADVMPTQKSEIVSRLQAEGDTVAMVGDGINDAPALAKADVGIAMGSGSDIAAETGGIILMRDDLRDVATGIQLARRTMAKVKQNLFWAFAYNVGLIPVAAGLFYLLTGVLLNPILSGAAMAVSSVTVVTNSLSLRRFKPKP